MSLLKAGKLSSRPDVQHYRVKPLFITRWFVLIAQLWPNSMPPVHMRISLQRLGNYIYRFLHTVGPPSFATASTSE